MFRCCHVVHRSSSSSHGDAKDPFFAHFAHCVAWQTAGAASCGERRSVLAQYRYACMRHAGDQIPQRAYIMGPETTHPSKRPPAKFGWNFGDLRLSSWVSQQWKHSLNTSCPGGASARGAGGARARGWASARLRIGARGRAARLRARAVWRSSDEIGTAQSSAEANCVIGCRHKLVA